MVNELHARPFPVLEAPCMAAYVAIKEPVDAANRDRALDKVHLLALLDRNGAAHPQPDATHYAGPIGRSELKWESPVGEKPVGYYVVMRETTSPIWEKKFFVTDTKAVLNYSKDNYYFGVQSVDNEGHESLVVIPRSVR
jgi:hypothetical protein